MGILLKYGETNGFLCDAKVSDLIDVSVKGWNCSLVDSSFSAYVAKIIKKSLCALPCLRTKLFGMVLLMVCFQL